MNRRGFIGSILATCAAPAIVRADALMRIVPRNTTIVLETMPLRPICQEMWTALLMKKFDEATVFAAIAQRDYEWEPRP